MENKLPNSCRNFIKLILRNGTLVGMSLILFVLLYFIMKRWLKPKISLLRFKSPPSYPSLNHNINGSLETLTNYIKNYGKTIRLRIGFKTILYTCDYKLISMLVSNDNFAQEPIHKNNSDRCLGMVYFNENLKDLVGLLEKKGKTLANNLEAFCEQSCNILPYISFCTLDIVYEILNGTSLPVEDFDTFKHFKTATQTLDLLLKRHLENAKNLKQNSFMEWLAKNEKMITNKELCQELNAFTFAGNQATAPAISFTLLCLAKAQSVQMEVFEEQQMIFYDKFDRDATLDDLRKMTYLGRVIMEALRLYPSVPIYSRQITRDLFYDGDYLPRGLKISMLVYELNRNPELFVEPELFKPNRFKKKNRFQFNNGPINCHNEKKDALFVEIKSIVSRLVRTYHILPAIPSRKPNLATEEVLSQNILVSRNGINVLFRKREIV